MNRTEVVLTAQETARTRSARVVGVGAATWDRFLRVRDFPKEEGVTEVLAETFDGGGPVATALCVLGHLGHECLLVDACGDDEAGRQSRASLGEHGVSPKGVLHRSGAVSAQATILVRQGDGARHILVQPGTVRAPEPEELKAEWFEGVRLLHVNGRHEAAARRAVELTRAAGGKVSFDGGAGRFRPELRDLVAGSDWLIVAREFAARFSGEPEASAPERLVEALLAETQAELVVVTGGAAGSWGAERGCAGGVFHQPAEPLERVVDTTGCGDVYHGAFLHGLLQGWPVRSCAAWATQWAAETARGVGGRCALRSPALTARLSHP